MIDTPAANRTWMSEEFARARVSPAIAKVIRLPTGPRRRPDQRSPRPGLRRRLIAAARLPTPGIRSGELGFMGVWSANVARPLILQRRHHH